MPVKRRGIQLRNGQMVPLPQLVPSFTSKGFRFIKDPDSGKQISDVSNALELTGPTITDCLLLSAYDIWHGYLADPYGHLSNKQLAIIDSGGYELSPEFDSTEPKEGPYTPNDEYGIDEYLEVLKALPKGAPLMITNFDHAVRGEALSTQIAAAQSLFAEYPDFLHSFIIKPSGRERYVNVAEVIRHLQAMRKFDVIGMTEKEIGGNLLSRQKLIAELRLAMDRANIGAPIHVWGGLDPVVTPLYFCAGAEIFDGVSWLRYGYTQDVAVPKDAYHALESGVQSPWIRAESMRLAKNISYLEHVTIQFRRFVDTGRRDLSVFGKHAAAVEAALHILETELPELAGAD